ncbi:hypothetical protein L9F63_005115 [Diploptera punctata]|uniref:DUF4708 domain-containing protein n=1 Tax=Diploptera punctata TaxID=6984 RepID=A0AAD7ZE16_DIPPU|nr:hypothetical protein L9F63_005115 [Diploptera punctata]
MCFIVGYVNNNEKRQTSAKSNYHWQIFRCRQLIFTEPDILACPITGLESAIYIVMTDEFYKTGKLQSHLEKLNMTSNSPGPVNNQIYEACFHYTLIARICPLWNQVDNCLIQGRNFLTNPSIMDAIKFEMIIRDEELFLSVIPLRVKLPLLKREHLDENLIHILPSMKMGRVQSVTNEIPATCSYKTYKNLKRHWKNMYGYRLPESEDQLFYCSVTFNGNIFNPYTYPNLCVRKNPLIFLRHNDHLNILQKFISDVRSKLSKVCGKPFGVDSKILYAVPKLCSWNESLGEANLSKTPVNKLPVNQFKYISSVTKLESSSIYSDDTSTLQQNMVPSVANFHPSLIVCSKENEENSQKQEKRQVPVFKQICPVIVTQPTPVMGDMNARCLPTSSFNPFQSMSFLNPITPLPPKETSKKKPRTRPQIQPGVDVEELAKKRDLARVNTATLVNWLRSKQVPCKVKDRKSDLVEKVMDHLNLPH